MMILYYYIDLLEQQQQLWCVPGGGRVIESRWCWDDVRWHKASDIYINICARVCVCSARMWIGQTRDVQSWEANGIQTRRARSPLSALSFLSLDEPIVNAHTALLIYNSHVSLVYIRNTSAYTHYTGLAAFLFLYWRDEQIKKPVFSALSIAHLIMASTRCTLISKAMDWREKWLHSWYNDMFWTGSIIEINTPRTRSISCIFFLLSS